MSKDSGVERLVIFCLVENVYVFVVLLFFNVDGFVFVVFIVGFFFFFGVDGIFVKMDRVVFFIL